jgi:Skp family chaperone for outer membrane proteins
MWRRFSILLIVAAVSLSWAAGDRASATDNQLPKGIKFAVVDMQKVLRDAAAIRMIRPQMDKLKETYQKKFKKYEEELKVENLDLQRQRAILSPEAYGERQTTFKKRVNERQREVQTVRRLLDQAGSVALSKVHRAFYEVTAELAKERSLNLVMRKSGLLFVDPEFDISDEVLKRLDRRLPKVLVELPKPGTEPREGEATQN